MKNFNWLGRAECAKPEHRDLIGKWSPKAGEPVRLQLAVCRDCPVKAECLADGVGDPFSIRGGLLPEDRGGSRRCGTLSGKDAHKRAGTPLCEACRFAQAEATRRSRDKKRTAGAMR